MMYCDPDFITLAHELADRARAIVCAHYRAPAEREDKADASPVTIADRAVEQMVHEVVLRRFGDHGVRGEELPPDNPGAEFIWVVDPIDGTKAFICGVPVFTTLLALTRNGVPLLGVIDQPITGERWLGMAGERTRLNGQTVHARKREMLDGAVMCATQPEMFSGAEIAAFSDLAARVRFVRYGTDAYGYAALATGQVDLVVESDMAVYDYMALVPVVEGAGGRITDWRGRPLAMADGKSSVLAAGDPRLHAAALDIVSEHFPTI